MSHPYNGERDIGRTLDSLVTQDFDDFELLVQDDCSQDGTEQVVRRYERLDARITYQRNSENLGMPGNLNVAIRRARAPLVANLHDGDVYRRDLISAWKSALDQEPDAAFVFNQYDEVDRRGQHLRYQTPGFGARIERRELTRYLLEHFGSPVWGTVMGRRCCYESLGYFDLRYPFMADVAMWMRLNLTYPVAYVEEPLIQIYPHNADRPWYSLNWYYLYVAVAMREEIIDHLYAGDPVSIARARRRLRRMRDRVWIPLVGHCLKHRKRRELDQALEIFANDDSLALRAVACLGRPMSLALALLENAYGRRS